MAKFPEGNLVHLESEFRDAAEALFNPTVVKISITTPAGDTTEYVYGTNVELIRSSTGIYYINVNTTDKPGRWRYRWWSTGTGQASSSNKIFDVVANVPE